MKLRRLFAYCLPLAFAAAEELPLQSSWHDPKPVPPAFKLSLEMPEHLIIGQNITAALIVTNTSTEAFEIGVGGDYRSTGYPTRMKVRVRDGQGRALPELSSENYGFNGGGLSVSRQVQPQQSERIEFPLACYVSFPKAGEYTVYAGHDLGWKIGKGFPVASAKVTVAEPTADVAAKWVDESFDQDGGKEAYELEQIASVMRHPAYLPALRKQAESGQVYAVEGIGHVATQDATEALLRLTRHEKPEIVQRAFWQLMRRSPPLDAKPPILNWRQKSRYVSDPLLPMAWKNDFTQTASEAAIHSLTSQHKQVVEAAAMYLELCGTDSAAEALINALQSALNDPHPPRRNAETNNLDFPSPQQRLVKALDALRRRGWRIDHLGGTARSIARLRQLADDDVPKPKGDDWRSLMLTLVESGPPALKICALEAIPQPLGDAAVQAVLKALDDSDWGVVRVACEVAGTSNRPEFGTPLVQIVETMHEAVLNRAAINAAMACGSRLPLWEALASNVIVPERFGESVRELVQGTIDLPFEGGGGGNSNFSREQRFAIRDAWRTFLRQHAKTLAAGKKVPPPPSDVAATLTGANFQPAQPAVSLQLKDTSYWPKLPGQK